MLTLFKSLGMSRQFWSHYLIKYVYLIEKVQSVFTKYSTGMRPFYYSKHLGILKLYSPHRRRESDIALFMCRNFLRDWFQRSLILSHALSLIVGENLVLYIMMVLVDWHIKVLLYFG